MSTTSILKAEPDLDLNAMAAIVRGLIEGGVSRIQDGAWLREQSAAAGLGDHARAALEALRLKLSAGGAALLDATAIMSWE